MLAPSLYPYVQVSENPFRFFQSLNDNAVVNALTPLIRFREIVPGVDGARGMTGVELAWLASADPC